MKKAFLSISLFVISFFLVLSILYISKAYPKIKTARRKISYIFVKPNNYPPKVKLVRIEIDLNDDTLAKRSLKEVIFNNTKIPLEKTDPMGKRGKAYFQLKPGKYDLKWEVYKNKIAYPRYTTHKKTIDIKDKDKWIHISITGIRATVST